MIADPFDPMDPTFHIDLPPTEADMRAGDRLAYELGDTFITCHTDSPVEQWTTIVKQLRLRGYKIVSES